MPKLPVPPRRTRESLPSPGVAISPFLTDLQYARLKACADEEGDDIAGVVVDAIELHLDERGSVIDDGVLLEREPDLFAGLVS